MDSLITGIFVSLLLFLTWSLYMRRKQAIELRKQCSELEIKLEERDIKLENEVRERRQAETILKASELRNRLIIYSAQITVWEWDLNSDEMLWNENLTELFGHPLGYTRNTKQWWLDNIHPNDLQLVMDSIGEYLMLGDGIWREEYRFRRFDGGWSCVLHWGLAIADEDGKPIRMVGAMMDITERKLLEEKLKFQAVHDQLTGLFNRRVLQERLSDEGDRAMRYDHPLSVFILDVDHFKRINDTHGHLIGDTVLCKLASILENATRKTDFLARYGGEEFVVVLPETSLDTALLLAERLREEITDQPVILDDGHHIEVTASIGIASFPSHSQSPQDLLTIADRALYQAKQQGRNRVSTIH